MSGAQDLAGALLAALRADAEVRAAFGTPARVMLEDSPQPAFPYARLERHEITPANASLVRASEHRLTFGVYHRHADLSIARRDLARLSAAAERATLNVPGLHIILLHAVYADVVRAADGKTLRGLLRLRIITEETA